MDSNVGVRGDLDTRKITAAKPHKARSFRLPFNKGRVILSRDPGDSLITSKEVFATHLEAVKRGASGEFLKSVDLGSGFVTNVGVLAMCNDFAWAAPSEASVATLALATWHATGTGTTTAKRTNIALETPAAPTTANAVKGTQSTSSATLKQEYKSIATITYEGTVAVTEWGLFTAKTLSESTKNTAVSSSTATVEATYTASDAKTQGKQQFIVEYATAKSFGLIYSNEVHKLTVKQWIATAEAGTEPGTEPGASEACTVKPVMWDHKVFAPLTVEASDSIEFKYSLLIESGG